MAQSSTLNSPIKSTLTSIQISASDDQTLVLLVIGALLLVIAALILFLIYLWQDKQLRSQRLRSLGNTLWLFAEGNWEQRAQVQMKDEIGNIAQSFNKVADELIILSKTNEAEKTERKQDNSTLQKVAQLLTTSPDLEELNKSTVELLIQRFNLIKASIHLESETLPVPDSNTESGEGNCPKTNGLDKPHESHLVYSIPLYFGGSQLGSLDIQFQNGSNYSQRAIETMKADQIGEIQAIANVIAPAIRCYQLNSGYIQDCSSINQSDEPTPVEEISTTEVDSSDLQQRMIIVQTLEAISQITAEKTGLQELYRVIHKQIIQAMGEVDFLIAFYEPELDKIKIPYASEKGNIINLPLMPLGEGLTSIVIRTQKPLMLVENTEERGRELGAKVFGSPSKSWLGVPLLVGGKAIGAIVVQDIENEYRFDGNQLQLMTLLAAQVAVVINNAKLLDSAQRQSELQQQTLRVTDKIRRSTDIQSILRMTADELGAFLGVRRAHIEIQVEPNAMAASNISEMSS